ncbi:MAG: ABC transporter permease, partial [Verrucomicrobiota bacterium]
MRLFATIRIALRALRRNKLRTFLTMLGMIIGVAAVIAMVSIGNGAKSQIEGQIASLGQNVLSVFPGSLSSGGARGGWGSMSTLTPEEAQLIATEISGVMAVSGEVRDRQQVQANGMNWNTQVQGESPDYLGIRAWPLSDGAMFSEADVRSAAKVAVIGKTVADQLFAGSDPLGQTIRLRNIPFKIIGVLTSKGVSFFGSDQDDTVVIPYTSAMRRVMGRQYLSAILIQSSSPKDMSRIQTEVTSLLQQRRGGREADFTV